MAKSPQSEIGIINPEYSSDPREDFRHGFDTDAEAVWKIKGMKRLCISSVYQGRYNRSIPRPMSRQIVVQVATGHLVGSQLDSIQRLVYLRDQPATLPNREKRKKKRVILWVPSAGQ